MRSADIIRPRNTSKKWKRIKKLSSSDESYQDFIVNLETPKMVHIKKDKNRKRARNEDSYAQSIRKIKRNNGEEYMTKKSKLVNGKIFENKDCFCSKKCLDRVEYNERKSNFDHFWKLKDFETHNLYVCTTVHQ